MPRTDLAEKLSHIERDLSDARGRRATAARKAQTAREAFTKVPGYSTSSSEFRAAEQALAQVRSIDAEIADTQESQIGVLKMLGRGDTAKAQPSSIDTRTPGGWLAREIRRKALGIDDIGSTTDVGSPFFDRLRERSALMSSGVSLLDIDTSEVKVPVLTGRITPSVPVPELEPIPEGDPPIENKTIRPPKYGKLVTLSLEAYRDARPIVLAATERELVGSIAEGFDANAFAGAANNVQPGIINVPGVVAVDATAGWTNLDPFVSAAPALRTAGAAATAIYMHPLDYEIAGKLKKATGSNEPLVSGLRSATDRPVEDILGVPVYQSTTIPRHKVIVAQANELLIVRRSDVETAVDENYLFSTAGVGFRTIARMALVVVQPAAVVVISLPVA